jgi:hypothetical protein
MLDRSDLGIGPTLLLVRVSISSRNCKRSGAMPGSYAETQKYTPRNFEVVPMFIRPWLEALKSRVVPGNRLNKRRVEDHSRLVQAQVEMLEDKAMLSAFDLVTVIPNEGVFLTDGAKMNEAPREVTLRFSPGQSIDPTSIAGAISINRAGVDGNFNTADDATVPIGYVGPGDLPNEVIVRFAQTLVDDKYQIHIAGSGANALTSVTDTFNNGANKIFNFELDLGAQVESVVPQPIIRSAVFSATGLSTLTDGDVVTVTAGANTYKFEINLLPNGAVTPGNIPVNVAVGSSASMIADDLVAAINANASGVLTAADGGTNTLTVTGSAFEPVVAFTTTKIDAFAKTFLTVANAATLADGDQVKVTFNNTVYTFEMNKAPSNSVAIGSIRVNFSAGDTAATIAGNLAAAINALSINSPSQQLKATVVGNSIALTGIAALGTPSVAFTTATAGSLTQVVGALAQATNKVVVYFNQDQLDPVTAQDPTYYQLFDTNVPPPQTTVNVLASGPSFADGDLFTVSLGAGTPLVFEFDTDNAVTAGHIKIDLVANNTSAKIAQALSAAINLPANNPSQTILSSYTAAQTSFSLSVAAGGDRTPDASWTVGGEFSLVRTGAGAGMLLPQKVDYVYNTTTGLSVAVLTFASPLANSTYHLQVGASSESSTTPVNVGTVFATQHYLSNGWLGDGASSVVSNSASDTDLYQFTATTTGNITITLDSSVTLDGIITLFDSNGSQVGAQIGAPVNASVAGGPETLTFTPTIPGGGQSHIYYVLISSNGGTGSYQLVISSGAPVSNSDDNSSFGTATNLGNLGTSGLAATGAITSQAAFVTMPQLPGGADEPGHRQLPPGAFTGLSAPEVDHGTATDSGPSPPGTTAVQTYSFPATYGGGLFNQITDAQKDIIRTIFALYSYEVGIQFREVASNGNEQIVVGNIQVNAPTLAATAAGGISGSPLIINSIFYANDNTFGGGFTTTALHEIGHNLGLGHSYDVPSIQGGGTTTGGSTEPVFTGDNDLIHLLRNLPDNSSDIDMYQFNVTQTGTLSAQTIAQRLNAADLLNTVLTLYKIDAAGNKVVVARNDDFYSVDSGFNISVDPGTYYIGVTSVGNENYDPSISNSGFGGRSQGAYQLKLDFTPTATSTSGLQDTTGQFLDGNADGKAGGVNDSWFQVAPTIVVDKLAPVGGNGTIGSPFNTISAGLAASSAGSIVRIVGNGGADGNASTVSDNVPYLIGKDYNLAQTPLADGATFQVPKGVTVMIDAGAVIKLHGTTIDVGTSSAGIDRSHGALQVLGTPVSNVNFTSWRDDASGSLDDGVNGAAAGGDWGGIVFRADSDTVSATDATAGGVFLDTVNHATIQYGGGQVSVDGATPQTYNALYLVASRPTLTHNIIKNNADAAISANPDSFKADDLRIGPDVQGNLITQNSTNGLFVRVQTSLGGQFEMLNVIAEFASTDITYDITQNLILNGRPADALSNPVSARLLIDPGVVVKLSGARIETGVGQSNLIAEGTAADPIRFTSQQDDTYGAGGTFDIKNDGFTAPQAGNWSGIYVSQASTASLDHVSVTYAGGASEISGNTDNFNALEVYQGTLRVTNSLFENNAGGAASTSRGGRLGNDSSTIFVRGSQPILVDNTFIDNVGSVISINANALQDVVKPDYGRSTGTNDAFSQFDDNYGPLVRLNKFTNTSNFAGGNIMGMMVRPEELTIESIWDDTDIAHVVEGTIYSSEFHTYGGLTLQSSSTGSLVVKLLGANAGFSATGDPLEISNRIGGTVDVIGQPNFPVILTSLNDDTVSAGFQPNGFPQFDTNGDGPSTGSPGDWNSLSFDQYSNDTNVDLINETEPGVTHGTDINSTINNPQFLGNLAPNLVSGDENRRLGFEVHGFISPDSPGDVDVYSFTAPAGTQVWIDTDFTSQRLDDMVELLDSSGNVLARSLDSQTESAGTTSLSGSLLNTVNGVAVPPVAGVTNSDLNTLIQDPNLGIDFYTSNFHDAGFRAVLPGTAGALITYFVRVRSQPVAGQEAAAIPAGGNGLTSGAYQLQVRLQQVDEIPGSTVRYADIRYATNGIETHGLPAHNPLVSESGETTGDNNSIPGAQNLGPFLQTDRNTLSVSGNLASATDVDYYTFTVDYSQVQVISGGSDGGKFFPAMFDIDYADGLTRADTSIAVYNGSGQLIYIGRSSDIADDQPRPGQGNDLTDLTAGSLSTRDPSIGTVNLPAGVAGISEAGGINSNPPPAGLTTYYVAVFSNGMLPTALSAVFNSAASPENQRVRLEPVDSIRRVVEDHVGTTGYNSQGSNIAPIDGPLFNVGSAISLATNIRPFTLSDVNLFIVNGGQLSIVDPFNGRTEIGYNPTNGSTPYNDIDMLPDGRLFGVLNNSGNQGLFTQVDTGTGGISPVGDGIATPGVDSYQQNAGAPDALAFHENGSDNFDYLVYAIQSSDGYTTTKPPSATPPNPTYQEDPGVDPPSSTVVDPITAVPGNTISKLYRGNASGSAAFSQNNTGAVGNITDAQGKITTKTTGLQYFNGSLFGVDTAGQFYQIFNNASVNTGSGNPDDNIADNLAPSGYPQNLAFNVSDLVAAGRLSAGEQFVGLTQAPQNVENGAYAGFLFALTNLGNLLAIDPNSPTTQHTIFLKNGAAGTTIGLTDKLQITGAAGATGLAFSPVDFNLWHPTELNANSAGHGVNTTSGTPGAPSVDNSRTPTAELNAGVAFGSESETDTESSGGASLYFGLENYNPGVGGNYYQYQSGGQYGVLSSSSQQDLTGGTSSIHNNYNVPGGTSGSLVTNSFNLEGYAPGDKPTLYFNYYLDAGASSGNTLGSMQDAARVWVSPDNGQTWQLLATNDSMLSTGGKTDAELPAYLSQDASASGNSNQRVQQLFNQTDGSTWRQARVDLSSYVGKTQLKLRFDFSTSGNMGSVKDPTTNLFYPSDDLSNPTYRSDQLINDGVAQTSAATAAAQNNNHTGFFVDDIIVGFAGRGEMVTGAGSNGSTFANLESNPFGQATKNPDLKATPQLLQGDYQLEIRRGEDYGSLAKPTKSDVAINPTLDVNDRLSEGWTVDVGNNVSLGNTITVSDGIITKTFEFASSVAVNPLPDGNIPVLRGGSAAQGTNATNLAAAITAAFNGVVGRNKVIGKAVAAGNAGNSDRVDIFDAITVTVVGTPVPAPTTFTDSGLNNNIPIAGFAGTIPGTPAAGNYVLNGGTITSNSDQQDFYQFSLAAGQQISVDLTQTAGAGNYALAILDNNQNVLTFAQNGPLTYFTATAATPLFLGVVGGGTAADIFTYMLNVTLQTPGVSLLTTMTATGYNRKGDDNLVRTQGQIIIQDNSILNSSKAGILVDDNDFFGTVPHPGAPISTPVPSAGLLTGMYLQNNTISRFGTAGIQIDGDPNQVADGTSVPFVKVVNNTIYGSDTERPTDGTIGILVGHNASPTLMNNAIINTQTAISVNASSGTTEVEANLFQGNRGSSTFGNNSLVNVAATSASLFVNAANDNYYPASGSPLIDSSRSTFNDRVTYSNVVSGLGIPLSPIIAPLTDQFGQARVDDLTQPGPVNQPGLGSNPFQDRGSIERADFNGGIVIPTGPQDNDGNGIDLDPSANTIWIDAANPAAPFNIVTSFTLQLIDTGIGIDDSTVDTSDFLLVKNGTPLNADSSVGSVDYFFNYNPNTNEVIFTSVSTFDLDARYQIIVNPAGIQDLAGNNLLNNQAAPITPVNPLLPAPFSTSLLYFTYVITDGQNQAPVVSENGTAVSGTAAPVTISEDSSITFSAALGNEITVFDQDAYLASDGDPDAGNEAGRIRTTVSIPSGFGTLALAANSTTNLLANSGDVTLSGSPVNKIVLEGRIEDINTALNGLKFTPTPDFPIGLPAATVNVTVFSEDLGKFGPPAPGTTILQTTTVLLPVVITPVNDAPTLTASTPITILEDKATPTQIALTNITAGGGEQQKLKVTVFSNNTNLIPAANLVVNYATSADPVGTPQLTTGNIQFTSAANQFGTAIVTVTVTDAGLDGIFGDADDLSVSQDVTINVTGVNDAPSIDKPADQTSLEDVSTDVSLTGISVGPFEYPSQTLTLTAVSNDQTLIPNGNISISYVQGQPMATLTYTPGANRNGGPVTITITAKDDGGLANGGIDTVITSFVVNVTAVDDPPTVTVPVNATVLEDSVSGLAPNPAGSDIVLTGITTGPFEGLQTITSVTVTSSDQSIVPDASIVKGTLTGGQLPLSITPLPNQFGPVTITVTITDSGMNATPNGDINFITKSFILNVLPVDDAPSFNVVPTQTIFEDAPLQTLVLTGLSAGPANESGQTLTLSAVSLTPGLIPDPTVVGNNTLMYKPVANANGMAQILVTLKDNGATGTTGDSDTYQQIITINVTPVNDPPTLDPIANQPQSGLLLEDAGQQTVNLTGITAGPADESGQTVTVTAAITGGNLNLVNNLVASLVSGSGTATLNYTPVANENGTATVTVTVTDNGANGVNGNVNFFTRTFTITVTPVNDAPSFDVVLPQTVLEDAGQQTLVLTGVVPGPANESSQTLILSAVSLTPNLVSDPTVIGTNTLKYTTLPDANGQAVIRVTLKDNNGTSNGGVDTYTQDIIINITPVNDAPTLTGIPNQPTTGLLLEDSGQQTVNLSGMTPGPADENTQSLVVSATVTGGNLNLINNLITSAVSGTGTATLNYTPVANEFGTATISVTVTDNGPNGVNGAVNFITKTFTITVTPVNDAPSFDPVFPITILEDAPQQVISLTGLSTGPANESSQTLILSAVSLNPNLIGNPTVVGNDTLKFTPVANAVGTATIRVTMKDNGGISNGGIDTFTQDIVVNITPVNDAPTLDPINAVPSSGLLLEDAGQQTVNLTGITAGPADESGQALSVSAVVTSGNLNLINNLFTTSVSGTGTATLKFIPTPNEFGTATVTVTVTDSGPNGGANGDVNFTTRTFTITVTPVNDQPTINALPDQVVNEDENNGQHTIQLTGISTGPLNEASQTFPTFSAVSSNPALIPNDLTHLSITYNPGDSTGQLNYTTVPNGFGTATITLTLKDSGGTANGGSDTIIRTFKITVNQVPDAPTSTSLSNSQVPENQPAGTLVGTFTTQDVDLPDDNFTYSIVGGTGQGVFQVNGNQLVTTQSLDFEPPALNSYTLTVRTTDKFGKTLDSTFNVIVLNLNDAPTLDPLSPVIFNEDPATPFLVNLSGITAGFGENQSLTVTATSDNPSLFDNPLPINYVSPNSTGTLQLSPKLNANGSATITVTVQDNGGTAGGGVNTVTRTFTVTVLPVNDNPTDINLSNNTIPEIAAGTAIPAHVLVGQLSSIDPDNPLAGDTFTYTLVSGTGSNDNLKFSIFNNQLFAEGPIDFDTQPDYTIRVRSTDSGAPNLSFDKVLTIHSTNVNEPATGISTAANPISGTPNSIPENQPAGSVVGSLVAADPDAGDSSTFSLVSGVGSDNNGLFQIINGQLVANASFDFETVNSYTVRIRSTDSHGLSFETPVTIHVTNVDEVSTDVNLSNNIVPEDIALGATVGLLSTVDVDNPEAFTYSLAAGAGSTDNGRFAIVGNKLVAASALNFEERPSHSYSVRVRSTDIGGLTFEKVFTVNVTDVNEAPTDLTLSPASINENLPAGSLVGTLIPIDQDLNDTYTYTFVNGAGSDDNSSFELNGSKLVSAVPFDFETKASYTVRVQATDGGGHQIERQFTIAINNEKDPPVIVLANSTLSTTGKKAVTIDTGATITDNDSPNFDGGKLKVYIQSGEQTGDTISFKNEKRVKGQLTLKTTHGKTVLVLGKQQIGTVSGGVRGIPLVIQFGTGISQELFQRVMRDITFKGKPFAAPRQLAMQAFDETGLASNIAIRNINVN